MCVPGGGPGNTQRGPTASVHTHGWGVVREGFQENVSELSPKDDQKLPKVHWQMGKRCFTSSPVDAGVRAKVVHKLPGVRWGQDKGGS